MSFSSVLHSYNFYGCSTWKSIEAAYVKCMKSFFGFERRYSVTKMFCDLGLPTFNTMIHYAQITLDSSVDIHNNELVKQLFRMAFGKFFSMLSVSYVFLCLPVFLSFYWFISFFIGQVACIKSDLICFDYSGRSIARRSSPRRCTEL